MAWPSPSQRTYRTLLVEPDAMLRQVLLPFLQEEGYETEQVASLQEAFTKPDECPFDCVVMDSFTACVGYLRHKLSIYGQ